MRMSHPGRNGQANAAPWRRWLFPAAAMASLVTLLAASGGARAGVPLTYTQFVADVGAGTVRAVTISPAGQVTGSLAAGQPFTTTIPVALGGNSLAGALAAHHVQVSATTGTSSPLLSALFSLLPLLLIGGLLLIFVRAVRRHASGLGGLGGAGALAKAKAQVIDDERPATRFADVAGYPAVKTEVMEVVDYLRDPARYHRAGARGPRGVLMAGAAGHRQDPAGARGRRRGPRPIPVSLRLELRGDVRRRRGGPRPGSVRASPRARTGQEFDSIFATNVRAPYLLVGAFAPGMAAKGSGSIINISAMAGRIGLAGGAAYGATKAALASLTQGWTAEYSPRGVRVNAVAAGPIHTRPEARQRSDSLGATTALHRASEPSEIAEVVALLASPRASYITGAVVAADGGRTAI
jgi:NAD(P)-dependent dehydrogenase (short-subunit alcohol dehydrogenase family)